MTAANDDIVDHIITNTDIKDTEQFEVEQLGNDKADYRSFKISSSSIEHHMMIMSIWSPLYIARDFRANKKSDSSFERSVGSQSKYGMHTPARYNENQMKRQRNGNYRENIVNSQRFTPRYDRKQVMRQNTNDRHDKVVRFNNGPNRNRNQMLNERESFPKTQPNRNDSGYKNQMGENNAQQPAYFSSYPAQQFKSAPHLTNVPPVLNVQPQMIQNAGFLGPTIAPPSFIHQQEQNQQLQNHHHLQQQQQQQFRQYQQTQM